MKSYLAENQAFGPYVIKRLLGSGGMGEVYEAYEERLRRPVALKVLTTRIGSMDQSTADQDLRQFMQEARTLAAISHPNVVTVYAIDQIDDIPFIAMEFVDGVTLRKLLEHYVLSAQEAVPLFLQVLEGIQELHANQILHRDITPGNIILRPNGKIKILDFGIAQQLGAETDRTLTGIITGTVHFMAPEVYAGDPATMRSDLWSLGAVFYETVSGRRMVRDNAFVQLAGGDYGLRFNSECLNWVPMDLQKVISKLCDLDPSRRYGSAAQVIADLKILMLRLPRDLQSPIGALTRQISNIEPIARYLTNQGLSEVLTKRALTIAVREQAIQRIHVSDDTVKVDQSPIMALTREVVDAAKISLRKESTNPAPSGPIAKPRVGVKSRLVIVLEAMVLIAILNFGYRQYSVRSEIPNTETHVPQSIARPTVSVMTDNHAMREKLLVQIGSEEKKLRELEEVYKTLESQRDSQISLSNQQIKQITDEIGKYEGEARQTSEEAALLKLAFTESQADLTLKFNRERLELLEQSKSLDEEIQSLRAQIRQKIDSRAPASETKLMSEEISKLVEKYKSLSSDVTASRNAERSEVTSLNAEFQLKSAKLTAELLLTQKKIEELNLALVRLGQKQANALRGRVENLQSARQAVLKQRSAVEHLRAQLNNFSR